MKSKVFILYTGGTIGMATKDPNDPHSPLVAKELSELLSYAPGFKHDQAIQYRTDEARRLAKAKIPFLELDNANIIEFGSATLKPIDSSDMTPKNWAEIAQEIAKVYDDYDGFIILHGTDTMAFTSSALSFMFENLAKPVVVTGSQLPISNLRSDAVLNLVNAIYIAGYKATDLPLIPEVAIVFADRIIRGCRASKVSISDWDGFNSPNFPLLGSIGERIIINTKYLLPLPAANKKFFARTDFADKVVHISLFPGFGDEQMRKLFLDENTQGIIMRTYGAGNAPSSAAFLEMIKNAVDGKAIDGTSVVKGGRLIVNISQCSVGSVAMGLYEASSGLLERGVLSGFDLTPEAALTKLMWTLGAQFGEARTLQMQISQRGEQTESLFDLRYGGLSEEQAEVSYTNAVMPDRRLDRDSISRAMLRIAQLEVKDAREKDRVRIRVYMNMPNAEFGQASANDDHCVACVEFTRKNKHELQTRMQNKIRNVIGSGDVILTLYTDRKINGEGEWLPTKVFFNGLYVAIYAKS